MNKPFWAEARQTSNTYIYAHPLPEFETDLQFLSTLVAAAADYVAAHTAVPDPFAKSYCRCRQEDNRRSILPSLQDRSQPHTPTPAEVNASVRGMLGSNLCSWELRFKFFCCSSSSCSLSSPGKLGRSFQSIGIANSFWSYLVYLASFVLWEVK